MIYPKIWSTTLKVFSIVNKMIKKILASRNTYELVNNKTMGVQTSLKIKQKMKIFFLRETKREREREREKTFLCGKKICRKWERMTNL